MFRYILLFTGLLISMCKIIDGENYYSEYWQEFNWTQWEQNPFQISFYAKFDTGNHWKNIRSFQLSERFSYQASNNFSIRINYRYEHGRNIVPNSSWVWQHRLELEANPVFHPLYSLSIKTRNRLEIRKIENEPKINYRFRQRTMLVFPIKNETSLKEFSIYNEVFYNLSSHQFQQDRLCPSMLTFKVNDKLDLDVYFLIRFFLDEEIWKKSLVFGTQLNF